MTDVKLALGLLLLSLSIAVKNSSPHSRSVPRFPVKVGLESKTAECFWAVPPAHAEVAALETWSSLEGSSQQIDAGELAQFAALKWQATCEWGTIVKSSSEMDTAIGSNPTAEVTGMLLARADWFHGGVLGVCLFHRT